MNRKSFVPLARYVPAGGQSSFFKKPKPQDAYDSELETLVSAAQAIGVRRYDWGRGDFGFLINVENKYTMFLANDGVTFVVLGLVRGNGNDAHRVVENARDVYAAQTAFLHMPGGRVAAEIGMTGRMKTSRAPMTQWMERQVGTLTDVFEAAMTAAVFRDFLTAVAEAEDATVFHNILQDLDRI